MLERMLPEWRERMRDVQFSVTAVAQEAGMASDNVQRIMEGREGGLNPGVLTVRGIVEAIDFLRDRCPHCYRPNLTEALRHESARRAAKRRNNGKATK